MNLFAIFTIAFTILLISKNSSSKWHVWDKSLEWWQTTTLYQIYPRSFQDSDGDGIGDLKGIESRLNYFVETGIKTIWLSPIYRSAMADLGYDISNFTEVDPIFGSMDDFKSLVKGLKERGMYLLMDFVPNHSSDEHEWFQKSIQGIEPYKDYYMWKDGKRLENGSIVEPNNWLSLFSGAGWTWIETRKQYYYHQFSKKQPDLNLSNPDVQREFKDIMKFWLDLGVDGFRVDAVKHFMEDPEFHDEPCLSEFKDGCTKYVQMDHKYTVDWPTTYDLIIDWRKFLDEYRDKSPANHTRIMLTEAYTTMEYTMAYYGNQTHPGAQAPFNFFLVWWPRCDTNSSSYIQMINTWYNYMPDGEWANWVAGNHDNHRVATRLGNEMVDSIYMLGMLLPGTAVNYQGDELGQTDTVIRKDQIKDPNNNGGGGDDVRDPERGPFLWDDSDNAGFTSAKKPWEPISPAYWQLNLEAQKNATKSHYKIFKKLVDLRKTNTIQRGSLELYEISNWVFAFSRNLPGNESYFVIFNVGSEREVVVLGENIPNLPKNLSVVVSSISSNYETGDVVDTNVGVHSSSRPLILRPKSSLVLSTNYYSSQSTDSSKNQSSFAPSSLILSKIHFFILILSQALIFMNILS